ncbi:MAG TPA: N-acetylmuramoyl-L-alanine amidase [Methylophilaceae bacterium]|nr:N-acetylmuramoyl-L-alanine amidase [Methylophilaceae bacterium]HAJ72967.1 N-acetylmuramoyl-L-alanine amidase [Methylophilaceae bacterium]
MHKKLILLFFFVMAFVSAQAFAETNTITAARVWPAQDYTRIALEASAPLKHQLLILKNPERLVLDIEGVEMNTMVKTLSDRILSSDPYISQVRVAMFKPNVLRIVIDLKTEVNPNVFALPPAGDYKHRLVLDIYPIKDPLATMIDKLDKGKESAVVTAEPPKPIIEPLPPIPPEEPVNSDAVDSALKNIPAEAPNIPTTTESGVKAKVDAVKSKKSDRVLTIAIDAGHGGEDPGALGARGSHEKDVTLMIAKRLKDKIDAEDNMRGVLIRDGDYFIPLHDRVVKARKLKADLFVSIHADSFSNASARGSSVFALSERGATSASARYLAKKENESDLIGGVNLRNKDRELARTLLDLSQTATINDSIKLGKEVLDKISELNDLHTNHVEQAGFAVLKSPDIPSILVETAFISNPEEERKLNDTAHQEKLVSAILAGVKKYFGSNPPLSGNAVTSER